MVESLSVVVLADPDAAPVGVPPALAVDADRARRFDDPVDVDDVDAVDEELRRFDRDDESPEVDDDDRDDELRRFDRDDESPEVDDDRDDPPDDRDEPELDDDRDERELEDDRDEELRRFDDPDDDDRDEPELDEERDEPLDDDRDDRPVELPLLVVDEPPDALAVDPLREDPPSSVRHALGSGMPDVRLAT
jgi:hypothetical protein